MKMNNRIKALAEVPLQKRLLDDTGVRERLASAKQLQPVPHSRRTLWLLMAMLTTSAIVAGIVWLPTRKPVLHVEVVQHSPTSYVSEEVAPKNEDLPKNGGAERLRERRLGAVVQDTHTKVAITDDFVQVRRVSVSVGELKRMYVCVNEDEGTLSIPYHDARGTQCRQRIFTVRRQANADGEETCAVSVPQWAEPLFAIVSRSTKVGDAWSINSVTWRALSNAGSVSFSDSTILYHGSQQIVPVDVEVPMKTDRDTTKVRVLLFYEASPELVAILPPAAASTLAYELEQQRRLAAGEPSDAVCGETLQQPILDLCRTQSASIGDVRVSASTGGSMRCSFTLRRSTTIGVRVYDVAGNLVHTADRFMATAGYVDHVVPVQLPAGIYRVVIAAGDGDRTAHNVLVGDVP